MTKKKENNNQKFYGSVTVGERGQIVIPAEAREDLGIKPGDKLLSLNAHGDVVAFVKSESIQKQLNEFAKIIEGED